MRFEVMILLALLLMFPVSGKTEVYIKLDKDRVAVGDSIRVYVHASCDPPSPIEVMIKGPDSGELLYDSGGEKVDKFNETWDFQIPEDWEEGTYLVKVNLIENSNTSEFFEQFKVLKPKILNIEPLEVPYQGRTKILVNVETPDESRTTLSFKFIGLNFRFESKEDFKPDKNTTELFLNLRERYEATRDIDYALKPGIYAMEVKMKFNGKLYDSRIATIEVVKPKLSVNVPEEVMVGEQIRVEISTNRVNETFNGENYNGIILTLVGENYKAVKIVELNEKGTANITLETSRLSEGDYKLYIRDTGLTLKGLDFNSFGLLYYDLDPKERRAKDYYAQDDLLLVREIKITKTSQSKAKSVIFFEPTDQSVDEGDLVDYKILLSSAEKGLSAYELIVKISNASVAKINTIYFPEWAYEAYKLISGDYARLNAIDLKGEIDKGSTRVELARIKLKALEEGFTEIGVKVNRLDSDNGTPINSICYNAYLIVNSLPLDEINETEELLNSSLVLDREISELDELEEQYEQIVVEIVNSTPLEENKAEENHSSNFLNKKSPIPRPKGAEFKFEDLILLSGVGLAFVFIVGRGKIS